MQPGVRLTVFCLVGFMAMAIGMFAYKLTAPRPVSSAELAAMGAVLFEQPRILPAFELQDVSGARVGLDRLKGHWTYVFFGFTHCPDVCPGTLSILSRVAKGLDQKGFDGVEYWMVSVDPERDTPEHLAAYLDYFDPRFVGMRGEIPALDAFARSLHAVFVRVPGESEHYTMDHSTHVALINPDGHFVGIMRTPLKPDNFLRAFEAIQAVYRPAHPA